MFFVTRLPTIFHIDKGHIVRSYDGDKSPSAMLKYLTLKEFSKTPIWSGIWSPFGIGGRLARELNAFGKSAFQFVNFLYHSLGLMGSLTVGGFLILAFGLMVARFSTRDEEEEELEGETLISGNNKKLK